MAVYKVIQDIEAEDKLVGPLTLKGFIYALIAGFLAFINFKLLITTELGYFRWGLMFVFALPMLLFGLLASPLGREQPTEVWLLSRVRFFLKPKRRIWDQSGIKQLVTITAPVRTEKVRTKGLSQSEVKSRLKTLAMTMDTRGWAVKNVSVNLSHVPGYLEAEEAGESDRLIGVSNLPQAASTADVRPGDDILDEQTNPTARHFWDLLRIKDVERKQKNTERMKVATSDKPPKPKTPPTGYAQPAYHIPKDKDVLNIKLQEAEKAFRAAHPDAATPKAKPPAPPKPEVTGVSQAAKLELAQSGNDLSVASIQKLANRQPRVEQVGPSEVVISFH
ncbi:MAG: PrgI family protein [Candidatus Saccharimonadales bacterium]